MLLNNQNTKRIFLGIAVVLSVVVIILKQVIKSAMIATPSTAIIPASILILISSLLLITHTTIRGDVTKYIFLFAILLLSIKEFLWTGSVVSIILYIMLIISLFKSIEHKIINIMVIVDCVIKILLMFWYLADSISYYGGFYYALPDVVGLLSSLCASIGIWLIVFKPISNQSTTIKY